MDSNSRDAINVAKRGEFSSRTCLESQMQTNVLAVWLSQVSTTYRRDFSHGTSPKELISDEIRVSFVSSFSLYPLIQSSITVR